MTAGEIVISLLLLAALIGVVAILYICARVREAVEDASEPPIEMEGIDVLRDLGVSRGLERDVKGRGIN